MYMDKLANYFAVKYFLCTGTPVDKYNIRYKCSVHKTDKDAVDKLFEHGDGDAHFMVKTYGPMFYRKIQIQRRYAEIVDTRQS